MALAPDIQPPPQTAKYACECCHHKTPGWKITLEWLTFLAAVSAAVATGIYASITHSMWKEMQDDRRAWVGTDQSMRVVGKVRFTSAHIGKWDYVMMWVKFDVGLTDIGKSPALNEFEVFELYDFTKPWGTEDWQKTFCEDVYKAGRNSKSSTIIFPGITKSASREIARPFKKEPNGATHAIIASVAGCIYYKDVFGHERHTEVLYEPDWSDPTPTLENVSDQPVIVYRIISKFNLIEAHAD